MYCFFFVFEQPGFLENLSVISRHGKVLKVIKSLVIYSDTLISDMLVTLTYLFLLLL